MVEEDLIDRALTIIDLKPWALKARVVTEIRRLCRQSPDGWTVTSYRTVARRLQCSERYTFELMGPKNGSLWKIDRVLMRGDVGRGSRPTEYRVNPDPMRWRNVPWIPDLETRRLIFEAPCRAPVRSTDDAFLPRSHVAAPTDFVPRSHGAAEDSTVPRSQGAAPENDGAAPSDRGTNPAGESPSHLCLVSKPPTTTQEEEEGLRQTKATDKIINAIYAKTGGGYTYGTPAKRIAELATDENLAAILAAVQAAPPGLGPPKIVDYVEAVLAGRLRSLGQGPAHSADWLAKRIQTLRAVTAGRDPEDVEEQLRELSECETEAAQFKEAQ